RRTDLPDKPRNLFGFAKTLPGPEMEALLRQQVPAGDEAMRALALQRSLQVRRALLAAGVPATRLFLADPTLHRAEGGAGWTPQAGLTLQGR
ncbi:MAG: hypothetical protein KGL50_14160, partial [Burkholderiales bacterium]|nr:hypothetical protein [Burkholderiales bacterium]